MKTYLMTILATSVLANTQEDLRPTLDELKNAHDTFANAYNDAVAAVNTAFSGNQSEFDTTFVNAHGDLERAVSELEYCEDAHSSLGSEHEKLRK